MHRPRVDLAGLPVYLIALVPFWLGHRAPCPNVVTGHQHFCKLDVGYSENFEKPFPFKMASPSLVLKRTILNHPVL